MVNNLKMTYIWLFCIVFGSWIDFNLLQAPNACLPIQVTDGGMVTFDNDEHFSNIYSSIVVIDGGIVIVVSDLQPNNTLWPIYVSEWGKLISDRLVHSKKAS